MSRGEHLLDFLLRDAASMPGRDWQLDDKSGAPYTPLRPPPSPEQVHEWQAELATAIAVLADLERWPPEWRRGMLGDVLLEAGITLPYSIRVVREIVLQKGSGSALSA